MEKHRAIPEGFMQIGEIAKKADVSISTLRYYDREGLLTPSSESEGGYRLYDDKDLVRLIQIQTLKQLGFTLKEIKEQLAALDTPEDMVDALTEHEIAIEKRMDALSISLKEIRALKKEITQMQTVDFKKYASIVSALQHSNEYYWAVKYFDDDLYNHAINNFGRDEARSIAFIETMNHLNAESLKLEKSGELPESKRSQVFAKKYWEAVMDFTGGDMNLLSKLLEAVSKGVQEEAFHESNQFISLALDAYFIKLGYNPFEKTH